MTLFLTLSHTPHSIWHKSSISGGYSVMCDVLHGEGLKIGCLGSLLSHIGIWKELIPSEQEGGHPHVFTKHAYR